MNIIRLIIACAAMAMLTSSLRAQDTIGTLNSAANEPAANTPAGGGSPTSKPATKPGKPTKAQRLTDYYLEVYGKLTKSNDWLARTMGIISLARLDDPRVDTILLDLARKDGHPLVRIYAWEAMHAHQDTLDGATREKWERIGKELASKKMLRGDLRVGYLGLLQEEGPTVANKNLFWDLFLNTNSLNPDDMRTLEAMGDTLKAWQAPDVVEMLIKAMSKLDQAYRAEFILRRLTDSPPAAASTLWDKGSEAMWQQTQIKWAEWFRGMTFKEVAKGKGPAYKGTSAMIPRGEKIGDPPDSKWLRDVELNRFRLEQLDVGFVIDTTGSMGKVVEWVQHDVLKMMRAFDLLSREPRIGVTLYRDSGDEYVVKNIPLTSDTRALTKALQSASAKGGGDIPEAVCEGLTSMLSQKWSAGKRARKVILLIGDAPPQQNSLKKIDQLVGDYTQKGFVFYCVKVQTTFSSSHVNDPGNYDGVMKGFDDIAKKGNGQSVEVSFIEAEQNDALTLGTAQVRRGASPQQAMFKQVLSAAMEQDYQDRLDPFLNVLMQYVQDPIKEVRSPFVPYVKPVDNGRPPEKPKDPQAR